MLLGVGDRLWRLDGRRGTVTTDRTETRPAPQAGELTPAGLAMKLRQWGRDGRVYDAGKAREGGRRLFLIAVEEVGSRPPQRLVLGQDPETDLPAWWATQVQEGDGWRTANLTEARFDLPLPDRLFDPEALAAGSAAPAAGPR